jgi:TonB family protein
MKRVGLVLACLALASCATPNEGASSSAGAPALVAAPARSQPASCPAPTETLYVPQMPLPGFVPAAPSGSTVVAPKRLLAAEPAWPVASTRCREQGKVTITYCVTANGAVENVLVVISSGYARLDNAVLAWAARDRHTAGTVDGRARLYCGLVAEQRFEVDARAESSSAR